jgi:hypothetical protein
MKGHGSQFGRKKEVAIVALLTQRNIEEAARVTGVSASTLMNWMRDPEFDTAYREARRAAFGQSISRPMHATTAAVSTLLKIMLDPSAPASTKVRAADSVLNHATKAIELEDIEARVTDVFDQKIEAPKQLPTQPNPVEQYTACARWRGLDAGRRHAEAFVRWAPKTVVGNLLD